MDYQHLEKTAMCYRCIHKELCKTVYQADDLGIQESKWNCPKFTEENHQGGWIPVSERLPNDRDWYLGVFREPDTGFIGLPYICDYIGVVTKGTTKEGWILRGFTDIDYADDYIKSLECVAWQPLPEPYEK